MNGKEFFKTLKLKFTPDKESLNLVSTKLGESITKAFEDSPIGKTIAAGFTSALKGDNSIKSMFMSAVDEFAKIVKGALEELDNMLEFSQLSSSRTREYAFNYGFSSSEAYGFDKAMQQVGLQSEEDLWYMNSQETRQFQEAMTKYANRYTELYNQGFFERLQDYQYEMEAFKLDMQLEVIEFFMNNKDVIMATLKGLMKASEFIVKALGWIVDFFSLDSTRSTSQRSAATADIINSYSNARNTNVKIDNTFNNVAKSDQTWLANAGTMTYEQVVRALGGD